MNNSTIHTNDQNWDVLVVGLGPAGAALANLLGSQGLSVLAVDRAADIYKAPRAIALDNEALRILQRCGLPEGSFATMTISEVFMRSPYFGTYGKIDTSGTIDGHPKLVTFYQPELEKGLRTRLTQLPTVEIALETELLEFTDMDQCIEARLQLGSGQHRRIRARYLVGADGAGSLVRRLLELDFKGNTYPEDWLVVDGLHPPTSIDHIEFECRPERPVPHMPAPGNRQRWEFKLAPGETREQMERPEVIRELLKPWDPGQQIQIERVAVYRFHARVADRFCSGRTFLVGDAAHITPPFVGQGLVAGLRDVANLSWKLSWVCKGWAAPRLLESYDVERRPHARKMIQVAKWMGKLVMPRNRALALLSHGIVRSFSLVPRWRRFFETAEIKPPHAFNRGAFVAGRGAPGLNRGALFPQVWLRHGGTSGKVLPSDETLESGMALVGFGCDPVQLLDKASLQRWKSRGGTCIRIEARGHHQEGAYEDFLGQFPASRIPLRWLAVVRPDYALLHDGPADHARRIVDESLALLD